MNKLVTVLFISSIGLFGCAREPSDFLQAYIENEQASQALSEEQKEQALNHILEVKEKLGEHAIVDNNLGIIFDVNEKTDNAAKSFFAAISEIESLNQFEKKNQTGNSDQVENANGTSQAGSIYQTESSHAYKYSDKDRFSIYYNWGVFLGSKNQIDQAIMAYQKALDIDPTSIEAKHNIELLIKKKQQQEQEQQQNQENKDQNQQDQQNQNGESGSQDQQKKQEQKPEDNQDKDESSDSDKKNEQDRKGGQKYKPRPFQGNQLSEGDVKKILGELSRQDQNIRSQYDQQERKEPKNEKDW